MLLVLVIACSSCETDVIQENTSSADIQITTIENDGSIDFGYGLVQWRANITDAYKEAKRRGLIESGFLLTWEICDDDIEYWTYDYAHRGKPKAKPKSDDDYERWMPGLECQ